MAVLQVKCDSEIVEGGRVIRSALDRLAEGRLGIMRLTHRQIDPAKTAKAISRMRIDRQHALIAFFCRVKRSHRGERVSLTHERPSVPWICLQDCTRHLDGGLR